MPGSGDAVAVAALRLAGPAVLVQVLACDGLSLRHHLDAALCRARASAPGRF